jgi:hypothetical protein
VFVVNGVSALVVEFLVVHVQGAFHESIVVAFFVVAEVLEVKLVYLADYSLLLLV